MVNIADSPPNWTSPATPQILPDLYPLLLPSAAPRWGLTGVQDEGRARDLPAFSLASSWVILMWWGLNTWPLPRKPCGRESKPNSLKPLGRDTNWLTIRLFTTWKEILLSVWGTRIGNLHEGQEHSAPRKDSGEQIKETWNAWKKEANSGRSSDQPRLGRGCPQQISCYHPANQTDVSVSPSSCVALRKFYNLSTCHSLP